ncbi:hypothetical protein KAFR_0A01600 [Kazachstania africana CBS 2517]|uniref:Nucleolar protein Dnt1-like N-terminal domain-containing protein n=1 Tax=Kazachstania africana (strain ATCC 22294 / BCRC 22015 / CBS 2517 / CECT 1963 / NBRC 1671 / NRRL Y-8276) TaxID=1071382 RepID=H2AMJ8_KAZAF|nr:hypothetical protein KAFR_0A01600 [Kazachstania africana CBS 2517]CCF55598.1 hypothetical protein KAFR_0A01600 [Kazachstania africana CBS 2517]
MYKLQIVLLPPSAFTSQSYNNDPNSAIQNISMVSTTTSLSQRRSFFRQRYNPKASKKFLHFTSPSASLSHLADEIIERFNILYPHLTKSICILTLQDINSCDLDPDFIVKDVFNSNNIVHVLLKDDFTNENILSPVSKYSSLDRKNRSHSKKFSFQQPSRISTATHLPTQIRPILESKTLLGTPQFTTVTPYKPNRVEKPHAKPSIHPLANSSKTISETLKIPDPKTVKDLNTSYIQIDRTPFTEVKLTSNEASKTHNIQRTLLRQQSSIADKNGSPVRNNSSMEDITDNVHLAALPKAIHHNHRKEIVDHDVTDNTVLEIEPQKLTEDLQVEHPLLASPSSKADDKPTFDERNEPNVSFNSSFQKSDLISVFENDNITIPPWLAARASNTPRSPSRKKPYTTVLHKDIDNSKPDPRNILPQRTTRVAARKAAQKLAGNTTITKESSAEDSVVSEDDNLSSWSFIDTDNSSGIEENLSFSSDDDNDNDTYNEEMQTDFPAQRPPLKESVVLQHTAEESGDLNDASVENDFPAGISNGGGGSVSPPNGAETIAEKQGDINTEHSDSSHIYSKDTVGIETKLKQVVSMSKLKDIPIYNSGFNGATGNKFASRSIVSKPPLVSQNSTSTQIPITQFLQDLPKTTKTINHTASKSMFHSLPTKMRPSLSSMSDLANRAGVQKLGLVMLEKVRNFDGMSEEEPDAIELDHSDSDSHTKLV